MCACVIFYGHLCFCIRRKLGEISRFAHSVRVGEKFLRSLTPLACLSMFRLPKQLTAHPYCALWRNICSCRCILCPLLPNDIRVLFHEKALFLRFLSHLPLLYLAFFRRETSGRRPSELRLNSPPTKSAVC